MCGSLSFPRGDPLPGGGRMTSYPGRWLVVDLSRGSWEWITVPREEIALFLGGRGLGALELWRRVPKGADPFGDENVLIFAPGTLTGTDAPCSGRTTVLAKGPATGYYLKVSVGGHLGISLKLAGVDGLIFVGRAPEPRYLYLTPGTVRLEDARDLWGRTVRECTRVLKDRHGAEAEVACIGPAGEKLVRFASIMTSVYNAAARGGIGAVMGAKNLKAVVVDPRGGRLGVADPPTFRKLVRKAREALYNDSLAYDLHRFGTARDVDLLNELKLLPAYNFQRSHLPGEMRELSGRSWPELGYLKRIVGCGGCIYCCHRFTRVDEGPYAGVYSGGPEYETVAALGSGCGVTEIEPVLAANELCNDLGLDTISTGIVIQWAMECYQRGLLSREDCDGLELAFGNGDAVVELVRKIGHREGIGDLLAEGIARAAEKVGRGSERWAMQVRGLEHSGVETRGAYSYALAFAVNPRGPDHLHTECLAEFGGTKEAVEVVEKITGDRRYAVPDTVEKRAEIVRWHEDIYAVSDALGLCAFSTTAAYGIDEELAAGLFRAATGIPMGPEEIMRAGRRIVTLERCFNLREGLDPREEDRLPWRIMHERQNDLLSSDPVITPEKLRTMLREYYRLHGWDERSGVPLPETLDMLGLSFVKEELP